MRGEEGGGRREEGEDEGEEGGGRREEGGRKGRKGREEKRGEDPTQQVLNKHM